LCKENLAFFIFIFISLMQINPASINEPFKSEKVFSMRWLDHLIGPAFCSKRDQKAPFSQVFISTVLVEFVSFPVKTVTIA